MGEPQSLKEAKQLARGRIKELEADAEALREALREIEREVTANDDMRPGQTLVTLDRTLAIACAALSASEGKK